MQLLTTCLCAVMASPPLSLGSREKPPLSGSVYKLCSLYFTAAPSHVPGTDFTIVALNGFGTAIVFLRNKSKTAFVCNSSSSKKYVPLFYRLRFMFWR